MKLSPAPLAVSFVALVALIVAAGCGGGGTNATATGGSTNTSTSTTGVGSGTAELRVFNSVDANATIYMTFDNATQKKILKSAAVKLGTASSLPDVGMPPGAATAAVSTPDLQTLFTSSPLTFKINTNYTCYAAGSVVGGIHVVPLVDAPIPGALADVYIRFFNASILLGQAFDAYVLPAGSTSVPAGAVPLATGVGLGGVPSTQNNAAADANGYVLMPTGGAKTFSVILTAHGGTNPLFPATPITVSGSNFYTVTTYDTGATPATGIANVSDLRIG